MKKIFTKSLIITLAISTIVLVGGCTKKSTGNESDTSNKPATESTENNKETVSTNDSENTEAKTKLVLGTSADYPPYEFYATIDGKENIVGFDIDIAKEIAKDMGLELEIKDISFEGLLGALASDKVDIVIAGMTPTEKRKESADFSKIYYNATHGVVMKKEAATQVKSLGDLNGKVVGVQQGSIQAEMVHEKVTNAKEIKEVPKITDLILMLQTGKVDAVVMEKPVAESYSKTNSSIALTSIEVSDEAGGSAVAIKKGNIDLVKKVDETIDRLLKEGKIDEFLIEANKLADEQKK
ncbi:transporter substrate-binding domain-containing protein [Clostridium thermarum]|uniref:transporter substrate-binding domain-containing protein n=1 Tax=Clostridium thermarum TaxID=1716543 RepID=UPI0013D2151A|nr:transporter substrate-binding domain-containing protein [Clostridium thermarum]